MAQTKIRKEQLNSPAIQDEGIPVGTATTLNFVGTVIDATVSGTVARIFVTGSTGAGGMTIWDEGVPLGTATTLDVNGNDISATVSGSVARIYVSGTPVTNTLYYLNILTTDISEDLAAMRTLTPYKDTSGPWTSTATNCPAGETKHLIFATLPYYPYTETIAKGTFRFYVTVRQSGGTRVMHVRMKLYSQNTAGTQTLIATSNDSPALTGSYVTYELSVNGGPATLSTTDRIIVKVYYYGESGGTNADVTFQFANTDGERVEIPSHSDVFGLPDYSSYNGYLINGGFNYATRQAPSEATLTTYSSTSGTYGPDRWKMWMENSSIQYQRQDGLGETGLTSQYYGGFKKITNNGKMFIFQIVEGVDSVSMRSKFVTFQAKMKASSNKTIRMGVFELQTAGTIDSVPPVIITAANGNTSDPTMASNVAIITAAQSKSVTTAMQNFFVTVRVPATSKNLICAVWTDSQFTANDILYIAEAGLYVTPFPIQWTERPPVVEKQLCQRYLYITPDGSQVYGETGQWNMANATTSVSCIIQFPFEMRVPPLFSSSGNFRVDDSVSVTNVTSITQVSVTKQRIVVYAIVASGLTQYRNYKLSANNDATAKLIFDAEL
jgi:hypothetical protein